METSNTETTVSNVESIKTNLSERLTNAMDARLTKLELKFNSDIILSLEGLKYEFYDEVKKRNEIYFNNLVNSIHEEASHSSKEDISHREDVSADIKVSAGFGNNKHHVDKHDKVVDKHDKHDKVVDKHDKHEKVVDKHDKHEKVVDKHDKHEKKIQIKRLDDTKKEATTTPTTHKEERSKTPVRVVSKPIKDKDSKESKDSKGSKETVKHVERSRTPLPEKSTKKENLNKSVIVESHKGSEKTLTLDKHEKKHSITNISNNKTSPTKDDRKVSVAFGLTTKIPMYDNDIDKDKFHSANDRKSSVVTEKRNSLAMSTDKARKTSVIRSSESTGKRESITLKRESMSIKVKKESSQEIEKIVVKDKEQEKEKENVVKNKEDSSVEENKNSSVNELADKEKAAVSMPVNIDHEQESNY